MLGDKICTRQALNNDKHQDTDTAITCKCHKVRRSLWSMLACRNRQTRRTQNPLLAITCGFKSHRQHHGMFTSPHPFISFLTWKTPSRRGISTRQNWPFCHHIQGTHTAKYLIIKLLKFSTINFTVSCITSKGRMDYILPFNYVYII